MALAPAEAAREPIALITVALVGRRRRVVPLNPSILAFLPPRPSALSRRKRVKLRLGGSELGEGPG